MNTGTGIDTDTGLIEPEVHISGVIKGIIFHHGKSNAGDAAWLNHVNT